MEYREIADRENVDWCDGTDDGSYSRTSHQRGFAQPGFGRIHFADRRMTKSGLRRFLMLVAAIRHKHNRGQPQWLKLYEANTFAQRRALSEYRRVIPRRYSDTDRARVRQLMGRDGVLNDPRVKHIADWAMNRGGN